jgi:hypothetical protein
MDIFKMSKIENPKYFSKKTHQLTRCDHNALKLVRSLKKGVTIFFPYFLKGDFSCYII